MLVSDEVSDIELQQDTTNGIPVDAAMATTHAAMLGVWDKEADRFWVRNNLMLIANGILLGGAISADQNLKIKMLICFFGFFFSWIWLLLNKKSGYYVGRWRPVIERYEAEMLKRSSFPILPLTFVRPDKEDPLPKGSSERLKILVGIKRTRRGAGGIMQIVIIAFLFVWVIFGIFYGFNLTHPLAKNQSFVQNETSQNSIKSDGNNKSKELDMIPSGVVQIPTQKTENREKKK